MDMTYEVGMLQESRGQVLAKEEIEACIYYLKNCKLIKEAKEKAIKK